MNWIKENWLRYYHMHSKKKMYLFGALLCLLLGSFMVFNPLYFWGIVMALIVQLIGGIFEAVLRAEFATLTMITWPIGYFISYVIIGGVFYLLITPIGLFRSKRYKVGWIESVTDIDKKKLNE